MVKNIEPKFRKIESESTPPATRRYGPVVINSNPNEMVPERMAASVRQPNGRRDAAGGNPG